MNKKFLLKSILIVAIPLLFAGCQTINKVEIGDETLTCEQLKAEIGTVNDNRTNDNTKAVLGIGTAAAAAIALPVIGVGAIIAAPVLIPAAAIASVAGVTFGSVKGYDSYQNKERVAYLTDLYNKKGCASTTYASAPVAPVASTPSPVIKKVIRDKELLKMQKALSNMGYEPGIADGIYGAKTKAALEKFQEDNGLVITGIADAASKELLLDKATDEKRSEASPQGEKL